jgi:ornithine decarboxylase
MSEQPHVRSSLAGADRDRIIYDLTGIERQYDTLRRRLPGVRIRFAMKACPVDEVLADLAERGAGFDAASPGEIQQVLRTGVTPENVHYGNTVKSNAEIAEAHALGITTFATDCAEDVRAIARHAPGARVFCRLATSGEGALWGLTGKYGTDDPVAVLTEARRLGLVTAGLSIHVGSQQMTVRGWQRALDDLAVVVSELASCGIRLDHINLGGGLPAEGYLDRDGRSLTPPTEGIFAAVRAGMRRLRAAAGGELDFVVEPGRHLVADRGSIRAHVVRLTVRRQPWLYLSCGRFNGLYEADQIRYRLEFPTRTGGPTVPAVVAGPTCDSDDTLGGAPVPVPADLASGDPVWIHSAGAYSTSYTTQRFNGFEPLPCVTVRAERVRPIAADDWNAIVALEGDAYAAKGVSESRAVLESRARISPSTSFVLDASEGIGGYLLAMPYPPFRFPDLSQAENTRHRSSNLHLHDIVIGDEFRGLGWAKLMLRHLADTARSFRYEQISLVAVEGTMDFWSARGFRAYPGVPVPTGYGPNAVYMSRGITDES